MPRWTVDSPITLDFDQVTALRVRVISGSVAVLAAGDRCCLDIDHVTGPPLQVSHSGGVLTISYEDLSWENLPGWLKPQPHSAAITVTVPPGCPVQLGTATARAVVSGITAPASVKTVSGKVVLDGVTGTVDASTVSGDVDAQAVTGTIGLRSVSGDLTLAGGSVSRMRAKTLSGRITADIDLDAAGRVSVGTVSGPVAIRLPGQAAAQVDLRSGAGRVCSEFPGLRSSHAPGATMLNGQLGAGGPGQVRVRSMSGPITLLRRDDPPPAPQAASPAGGAR
ncbi:MAG: DUF4097 family beta strand repeat-containing protein [Streptosporangiales bacterium]